FQAEDGIRDLIVTGVQTCALPISGSGRPLRWAKGDELSSPSRYELLIKIGSGGMASVYVGRVSGSAGFSRLVAVKRAHSFVLNRSEERRVGKGCRYRGWREE